MSDDRIPPRQWPGKWVREETFWREMTTRTLSACLVGALGLSLAWFNGWIEGPGHPEVFMAVLLLPFLGLFLLVLISGYGGEEKRLDEAYQEVMRKRRRRRRPTRRPSRRSRRAHLAREIRAEDKRDQQESGIREA